MKKSNFYSLLQVAALLLAISVTSCSDEPFYTDKSSTTYANDGTIYFRASVHDKNDTGVNQSRSEGELPKCLYSSFSAQKIEGTDYYLQTAVDDGIDVGPLKPSSTESINESRAAIATASNIADKYADMRIDLYAFSYPNSANSGYNSYREAMNGGCDDVKVTYRNEHLNINKSDDGSSISLTSTNTLYWGSDASRNLTFLGVFPASEDYNINDAEEGDSSGSYEVAITDAYNNELADPYIKLTVPENIYAQDDVMTSEVTYLNNGKEWVSGQGTYSDSEKKAYIVPVKLQHIMTAVSVEVGAGLEGLIITSVELRNIKVKGTYKLFESYSTTVKDSEGNQTSISNFGNWTTEGDYATRSATFEHTTNMMSMKDKNVVFMMIPQTLPDNAQLAVTLYDKANNISKDYEISLLGHNWKKNTTVNYKLSSTSSEPRYIFETEFEEMYFSWDGTPAGEGETVSGRRFDFTRIKSYKAVTTGEGENAVTTFTPLGWTAARESASSTDPATYPSSNPAMTDDATNVTNDTYAIYYGNDTKLTGTYNFGLKFKLTKATPLNPDNMTTEALKKYFADKDEEVPDNLISDYKKLQSNKNTVLGSSSNYMYMPYYKPNGTTRSGGKSTSNCYIVNYPGYYMFPIVYGNGILNENNNKDAYVLGTTGSFAMNNLRTWRGSTIQYSNHSSAWIEYHNNSEYDHYPANDGKGASGTHDAYILWQDVDPSESTFQLVPYTSKSGEEYYCSFYIGGGDNFRPGNYVIAIRNTKNEVLWCYHIWVTPHDPDSSDDIMEVDANPLGGMGKTKFMNVPLGFVHGDVKIYPERSYPIILTQKNEAGTGTTGKTLTITLKQKEHWFSSQWCTYYQWGRPNPFPGAKITESGPMKSDDSYTLTTTPITYYCQSAPDASFSSRTGLITAQSGPDKSYQGNSSWPTDGSDHKYGIQNPLTFYTGWRFPNYNFWDLWGCITNRVADTSEGEIPNSIGGTSTRKTVYDPCPPGFKVPPVYGLPAVTVDGKNHTSINTPIEHNIEDEELMYANIINTPFKSHDDALKSLGYKFYKNARTSSGVDKDGGTYELYALGLYDPWTGTLINVGTDGYYWTCSNWTSSTGTTNTREYFLHFGYSSSSTSFHPIFGNTLTTYGMPIMMMVDTDNPVL